MKHKERYSQHKGVTRDKDTKKWKAQCKVGRCKLFFTT